MYDIDDFANIKRFIANIGGDVNILLQYYCCDKMKYFSFLMLLFFLASCKETDYTCFTSMKEVVERGKLEVKPSLVCFAKNVNDDNAINEGKLQGQFLCYMAADAFETELGKILQPNEYPVYLIVQGDSVYALLNTNELDSIGSLTNNKPIEECKYFNKVKFVNEMLKLSERLENDDSISPYEVSYLDSLVRNENLFYGKFLLAKLYNHIDKEKAYELYHDLWENTTTEEIQLYPDEYLEVMREKDRVIYVKKEDVKFDYTTFDFGKVKSHEEAECKFYFVNQSKINFMIYGITSTCGCTIPSWNKKPLKPGDRDSILVRLKVNEKSNIIKTITVKGNTDEVIRLQVKATII